MKSRIKDSAQMDLLADEKSAWLEQARRIAARIAYEEGSVTAEDIRAQFPIPGSINKNIMGRLFCDKKTFVWNGIKKSTTASRKGSLNSVWLLTEEARLQWGSHYKRKAV